MFKWITVTEDITVDKLAEQYGMFAADLCLVNPGPDVLNLHERQPEDHGRKWCDILSGMHWCGSCGL